MKQDQEVQEQQVELKKVIGKLYSKGELKTNGGNVYQKFEFETKSGSIMEFTIWNDVELLMPYNWDQELIVSYITKYKKGNSRTFATNFCNGIALYVRQAPVTVSTATATDKIIRDSSDSKWKAVYDQALGENKDAIKEWYRMLTLTHNCDFNFYHFFSQIMELKNKYGKALLNENYRKIKNFKGDRLMINHQNLEKLLFDLEYQADILTRFSK